MDHRLPRPPPGSGWACSPCAANKEVGFSDWAFTQEFGIAVLVVAVLLLAVVAVGGVFGARLARLRRVGPWLVALAIVLAAWEIGDRQARPAALAVLRAAAGLSTWYTDDWRRLGDSVLAAPAGRGFALGALIGFLTGVSIGWSRSVGYWVHPVLRFIGPLPATALAADRLLHLSRRAGAPARS